MLIQALLPAAVLWFCEACESFLLGTAMWKRPIVAGTLVGLVLGDVATGAIVGTQLEILYLGVVNVGGVQSTDTCFSAVFGAAIAILFDYTWEQALVIAIPVGYIGLVINQAMLFVCALFIPLLDRLIEEDKGSLFSKVYIAIGAVVKLMPAIAIFAGLYLGADALSALIANLPPVFQTAMNAVGGMLPAVGMGILLNYLWDAKLVIYLILGFAVAAFLKVSTVFMVIVAVFLAYVDYTRNASAAKIAPSKDGSVTNQDETEEFFE